MKLKKALKTIFSIPCLISLEAPVVASIWSYSIILDSSLLNDTSLILPLFCTTWIIYLLDRVYDLFKIKEKYLNNKYPGRMHNIKNRKTTLLAIIFILSAINIASLIIFNPNLSKLDITLLVSITSITTLYYMIRLKKSNFLLNLNKSYNLPLKEITISFCFSLGILSASKILNHSLIIFLLIFLITFIIVLTNTLLISYDEKEYDVIFDKMAFFSKSKYIKITYVYKILYILLTIQFILCTILYLLLFKMFAIIALLSAVSMIIILSIKIKFSNKKYFIQPYLDSSLALIGLFIVLMKLIKFN